MCANSGVEMGQKRMTRWAMPTLRGCGRYILLLLGSVGWLAACTGSMDRDLTPQERSFEAAVKERLANGADVVFLENVVSFKWKRVCVVGSYMPPEVVEERLGVRRGGTMHAVYSDRFWALAFLDFENNVDLIRIDRSQIGDYMGTKWSKGCVDGQAGLKLGKHEQGRRTFALIERQGE